MHARLFSSPSLLILAAVLVAGTAGVVINAIQLYADPNTPVSEAPIDASNFEIGQYYFNHDDDPSGPYDIEKAREYYTQAIHEDPKVNSLAWYQLGRIDFIQGNFSEALYSFDQQIRYFNEQVPNVYYMIGLTYGYKARASNSPEDWVRAEDAFKKFIEIAPQAPWSRVDLAWIYFAQGKFEQMLPVLEAGMSYRPENPWLLNMYGLALYNTGASERAGEQFAKAHLFASKLTPEDWGKAYPGNDPALWEMGLEEFQTVIEKNLALTQ